MKKRLSDERVSELVWHPTTMLWTDLAALVCEVQERRAAEQPVADAEIEAWHSMWSKRLCSGLELGEDGEMLTTAIALMRRARQQPEQPASSGLLAAADRMVRAAVFATDDSMVGEARDILSAALAAERERQPAPGYATREREDFEAIDGERMRLQSEIADLREQLKRAEEGIEDVKEHLGSIGCRDIYDAVANTKALRERAEKAEAEVTIVDTAIGDRGVPERDCRLPLPERVSNILSELKNWRHGYATASMRLEKAEAERDRLRGVIEAKHGGEPLALLSELDEAREQLKRAEAERDAARADAEAVGRLVEQLTRERDQLAMAPEIGAARAAGDAKLRELRRGLQASHDWVSDKDQKWGLARAMQRVDEVYGPAPEQPAAEPDILTPGTRVRHRRLGDIGDLGTVEPRDQDGRVWVKWDTGGRTHATDGYWRENLERVAEPEREQIPLLWQLYHVQDPDRPMFVVALSMQDAVSRWEAHIREENDCDAGDPPQGVTHTCDERDLLLPSELRRKEGR